MSKEQDALKLALEALDSLLSQYYADTTTRDDLEKAEKAITAIREALAEHIEQHLEMVEQSTCKQALQVEQPAQGETK